MSSLLPLLAALLATACLARGAESTSPRRSLTFDLIPTGLRSDSDKHKCFKSMLVLGLCKHDLVLASFFTERSVPLACCRAADEVDDHCGPFTRTFVRSLLPRGLFKRCARQVTIGAPTTRSSSRRAPPRSPPSPLATVPRVSGGARVPSVPEAQTSERLPPPHADIVSGGTHAAPGTKRPPVPEAETSARLPPPHADRVSGGTHAAPGTKKPHANARPRPPHAPQVSGRVPHPIAGSSTSVYLSPPYPVTDSRGKYTPPPPKVGSGPVVSGSPRAAGEPRSSAVPANEEAPKPKVITGGSAGGRMRRAPGSSYGPATGAPSAAASAPPNYGARMGTLNPKILP